MIYQGTISPARVQQKETAPLKRLENVYCFMNEYVCVLLLEIIINNVIIK
jgi:hypothetical protein